MTETTPNLGVRLPDDWGIQPVPPERRRLRAFDLALLWGDLAVSLLVMVAGSLLVPGLSTKQALAVIVIGTLLGTVLLSLVGIISSRTGVPTMVALRGSLGIRGSYTTTGLNILQLVGWAALEIIIMAQAARALSDHYLGFEGYYMWLVFFAVVGMAMAVGGPIVVVRQWMQKFGVWVVVGAAVWLTFYLFHAYDMSEIWRRSGEGGFPNFWQGVDLVVALPVSWLPLVGDYSRFARRAAPAALGTYAGYAIANIWFFMLGMLYVQALQTDPGGLVDALVKMMLPLTAGWLALIVLLTGETDEAFANIYSTAVSIQNLVPRATHAVLAVAVGIIATIVAVSLDLIQYENFLLLIGGVFVPVFGIMIADYFVLRRGRYAVDELYRRSGEYWYGWGVNPVGAVVWVVGFLIYAHAAQPPWLIEHADFVSWVPAWVTHIGGTIPTLAFTFVAYWAGIQVWLSLREGPVDVPTSAARAGGGN
ncbi:MAG: putative hydroxymethylpyrimidine transporter CytX [Dehalococcoidia bacterium]